MESALRHALRDRFGATQEIGPTVIQTIEVLQPNYYRIPGNVVTVWAAAEQLRSIDVLLKFTDVTL